MEAGIHSRWDRERINNWYDQRPWLIGCNFVPSNAVNQLEMWQAETYDPECIDRELGWARNIGMNSVRVFLHDLVWENDPEGLIDRMRHFLKIADKFGILTMFVFLDDCWNSNPRPGKQPPAIPGVHNSRWLQSPGVSKVSDVSSWPRLERYIQSVLEEFTADARILAWDLYNEPGNSDMGDKSLPLLRTVFDWARQVNPSQPLTAGLWSDLPGLNSFQLNASDILTFHHYRTVTHMKNIIREYQHHGRAILCTEYLARAQGSRFETHLPIFAHEKIGCFNWGLVAGKTQTYYPWGSQQGSPEPEVWFSDVLRKDGTPFDVEEVTFISALAQKYGGAY